MDKKDYIWLTRNTEINNFCENFEDCTAQSVIFKLFRKSHLPKIREIFAANQTEEYIDKDGNNYLNVKDLTISNLCETALQYNSNLIYNSADGKIYYDPADRRQYLHFLRRNTPKRLAGLSPQKKLDILFSINKACYSCARADDNHEAALNRQSDKLNALLQMPIPFEFWENEKRKIRLITAEISRIPNIKHQLENFASLSLNAQKRLLKQTIEITARYNGIKPPKMYLLTAKQMEQYNLADWTDTDAFALERNLYICTDKIKNQSGIRCLTLAWHETNHIAMAYGDYSRFAFMEDMLNSQLNYVNDLANSYIFHPQEKINYALEKQFIEECVARTGIKQLGNTFKPASEFDVATQYIARSLKKEY